MRLKTFFHHSSIPSARVLWLFCGLLFALCTAAQAQQSKKIHRIGYLSLRRPGSDSIRADGIRRSLRELGYIEGKNITFEFKYAENKADRVATLATELVSLKVDLIIVAGGDNLLRTVMSATKTIPIVMTGQGSDPVKTGFVRSLAHPGGNVTGLTVLNRELGGKRLELLKEIVPNATRVAVFYDPATPGTVQEVKEDLAVAARALGLLVQPLEVRNTDGVKNVLGALDKDRPDGLYVTLAGAVLRPNGKRIAGFALKNRLPSVWDIRRGVEDGGLVYYGADQAASYGRVANYVDRILKGAKPADLPVEQPTKFELVINLNAAKRIGLIIPPNVLARADKVIR